MELPWHIVGAYEIFIESIIGMEFLKLCWIFLFLISNYIKKYMAAYQKHGGMSGNMVDGVDVLGKTLCRFFSIKIKM